MRNEGTPPPQHAYEVSISIGGNTWEYVRRAARELAEYVEEREPEHCGLSSGGCGGCHSIDVARRDITPEAYDKELAVWAGHDKP